MIAVSIIQFLILIVSVIIHELAHGIIANRFGDPTAKLAGRLTLNPIPHIDKIGSILLPAVFILTGSPVYIAWAKPVPINLRNFSHPSRDMMLVAFAGPLANITLASLLAAALPALSRGAIGLITTTKLPTVIFWALENSPGIMTHAIVINLVIAIFNLLPIPPLDGSRILSHFLPPKYQFMLDKVEPYGILIIFLLAYFGIIAVVVQWVLIPLCQLMNVPI